EEGLDDLALDPPDGPKLIAFLKTMEFSSLTRRVAEATGAEPADIDPAYVEVAVAGRAHGPDMGAGTAGTTAEAAASPEAAKPALPAGAPDGAATPSMLAALRAEEAVADKIDVSAYHCIRDLATLEAWVREATEAGLVAFDTETTSLDPMQAELCGF